MTKFLCAQHTYNGIEVALFIDGKIVEKLSDDKKGASKNFVSLLDDLLKKNDCSLGQISFIAVNVGPGPFTTMRVVLSSINGLAFSTNKPVIGIDAFDVILQDFLLSGENNIFSNNLHDVKNNFNDNNITSENINVNNITSFTSMAGMSKLVILFDACASDVYFCLFDGKKFIKGCENIDLLINKLDGEKIYFIGNAVKKYREKIIAAFTDTAIIYDFLEFSSIEQLGKLSFDKWLKGGDFEKPVLPIYLKSFDTKN